MSYGDDEFGCGPAAILAVVVAALAFGAGTCAHAASKATLEDRCGRECSREHSSQDSWSDSTHICVCTNGHVAHIRTQATVLQTGTAPPADAGTKDEDTP
jgi:hypothetical protein